MQETPLTRWAPPALAVALLGAVLLAGVAAPAVAESHESPNSEFFASWKRDFQNACKKIQALAEAIPQESYGWRPMEGVRSVSENFMHVAGANFFFAGVLGAEKPEGLPEDLEAVTDKAEAMKLLEQSIEAVHQAVEKTSSGDIDTVDIELFGSTFSKRQLIFIIGGHAHEHLGQAIAYARSNQVVPPWSAPQPEGGAEG